MRSVSIRRLFSLFLLLFVLVSGCSRQYSLERDIYHANLKLQSLVSRIDQAPLGEIKAFESYLSYLLAKCKGRGLEFPIRRMQLRLASAEGDISKVEEIIKTVEADSDLVAKRRLLYDAFLYSLRDGHYKLALSLLNKIGEFFRRNSDSSNKGASASIPAWKCYVGLKLNNKQLCDQAIRFYEDKTLSQQIGDKFVGWRGLFIVNLMLGQVNVAVDSLNKIVFDLNMPPKVIVSSLQQQVFLLMKQKEYDKVLQVLNKFLDVYRSKIPKSLEKKLKEVISNIERIKKQTDEQNPSL